MFFYLPLSFPWGKISAIIRNSSFFASPPQLSRHVSSPAKRNLSSARGPISHSFFIPFTGRSEPTPLFFRFRPLTSQDPLHFLSNQRAGIFPTLLSHRGLPSVQFSSTTVHCKHWLQDSSSACKAWILPASSAEHPIHVYIYSRARSHAAFSCPLPTTRLQVHRTFSYHVN